MKDVGEVFKTYAFLEILGPFWFCVLIKSEADAENFCECKLEIRLLNYPGRELDWIRMQ